MGFIYIIRNNVNDKVYIGQTTYPIQKRFAFHVSAAYRNGSQKCKSHLHNAIRKYGKESFWIEQIEECEDSALSEREMFWIKEYDSYHRGYNNTIGGEGTRKYSNDELLDEWNSGLTASEIAQKLGVSSKHIGVRLHALGITEADIRNRASRLRFKKVYKYDLDGNYLEEYQSVKQLRQTYPQYCFTGIIDNPERSAGGFMWRTYKRDHIEPYRDTHNRREVHQYSLDGTYIKTFRSVRAAAQAVGVNRESLRDALKRSTKKCSGYLWSYEKIENLSKETAA